MHGILRISFHKLVPVRQNGDLQIVNLLLCTSLRQAWVRGISGEKAGWMVVVAGVEIPSRVNAVGASSFHSRRENRAETSRPHCPALVVTSFESKADRIASR